MKRSFVIILLLAACISCKKASFVSEDGDLEKQAFKFLAHRMSPADFSTLDWQRVRIENVNGQPGLLKIKHKSEQHKVILYGLLDGVSYANWVEVDILRREGPDISGTVTLSDLNNKMINRMKVDSKSRQRDNATGRFESDPGDLEPFVVIGYINNNPAPWWNLYWLFNNNMQWFGQYTNNAFIDPSCTTCLGNINDVLPFDILYPETAEILQFESDYLGTMSPEEAQIFSSLPRSQQLKYLWNAKRASEVAQALYQPPYQNGKSDAFRHAYFSALNAEALGLSLATLLANAHENVSNNPPLSREMDLRNNQVGRNAYLILAGLNLGSHFFKEGLAIKIKEMMENGELWYLGPLGLNGEIIPGITQLIPSNH